MMINPISLTVQHIYFLSNTYPQPPKMILGILMLKTQKAPPPITTRLLAKRRTERRSKGVARINPL